MAYKTILTIITDTDISASALEPAITLAWTPRREEAHLDVLCLGLDRTQTGYYYAGANALIQQETLHTGPARMPLKPRGRPSLRRLANEGLSPGPPPRSRWRRSVGLSGLVAHRARFSDLVVMPRPYGPGRPSRTKPSPRRRCSTATCRC